MTSNYFTVLYIEDDFLTAMNNEALFSDHPEMRLLVAADYDQADEYLRLNPDIDLVISDLGLPGPRGRGKHGGIDIYRLVQAQYAHIPFCYLTNSDGKIIADNFGDQAPRIFSDKNRLLEVIETMCRLHKAETPAAYGHLRSAGAVPLSAAAPA